MTLRKILPLLLICIVTSSFAQDDYLSGLRSNPVLKQFHKENPYFVFGEKTESFGKHGIIDTLELPFFDDFSTSAVFPNDSMWTDNTVFIGTDFPVGPPSIGVATFDGLDAYGNAYRDLDASFGSSDTFSSQPIDLTSLTPADSVILSFYYQAQGRSFEQLEKRDSLVLQFKNSLGAWVNVWSSEGITLQDFKLAMVKVNDTSFFHSGFQFRLINYLRFIGNLKQWHVDFIYMNKGRTMADTIFQDQALVYKTQSVIKNLQHVPWPHLKANAGKYLKTTYGNAVNNLSNTGETFSIEVDIKDNYGNVFGYDKLSGQALPANAITQFFTPLSLNFQPLAGDSISFFVKAKIGDILGGNEFRQNDSFTRKIEMANYFAYDDGTAETGYGIRNGSGKVALGFDLEFPDTLRAVSIHYTQAEAPVKNSFLLAVWQKIPAVGQSVGEQLVYTQQIPLPAYTDTINGFQTYYLDSAIALTGRFYVGWIQHTSFLLNVGWDRNYTFNDQPAINPNLFYNARGYWQNAGVSGTPLIRPHVGAFISEPVNVQEKPAIKTLTIYPNPGTGKFYIQSDLTGLRSYIVMDMAGKIKAKGEIEGDLINLSELSAGMYIVRISDSAGAGSAGKIIITK